MTVHFLFQLTQAARLLRQRVFVTFGQFLYAMREGLADAVHLAVYPGVERGHPFVIRDQRFYFSFGELRVFG
jgi:hypothetical protein